jgi:hypothetical protein
MTGQNVVYSSFTEVEYGENLLFESIPLDMLYTEATKPQVLVNVNGIPALCANLNCDYMYTTPSGAISGQSLTGNDLQVTGTSLSTSDISMQVGGVSCDDASGSDTELNCVLQNGPKAGSWNVELTDAFG